MRLFRSTKTLVSATCKIYSMQQTHRNKVWELWCNLQEAQADKRVDVGCLFQIIPAGLTLPKGEVL